MANTNGPLKRLDFANENDNRRGIKKLVVMHRGVVKPDSP
jgi:hypothetical protein